MQLQSPRMGYAQYHASHQAQLTPRSSYTAAQPPPGAVRMVDNAFHTTPPGPPVSVLLPGAQHAVPAISLGQLSPDQMKQLFEAQKQQQMNAVSTRSLSPTSQYQRNKTAHTQSRFDV